MKCCFKCLRDLPIDEFYRHAQMADGHLNKCKDCARIDVTRHRAAHVERIREYDRRRATEPRRKAINARVTREWRQGDRRRSRAHGIAQRTLRDGPVLCQGCGKEARLERHHHDYDKPLSVLWLCKPCHTLADKLRRLVEAF